MFSPTDVVVIVRQARHLLVKARNGINNAYATIEFQKEKYATGSEKSLTPKWFTECTFTLPHGGVFSSKVVVTICVYHKHHGKLGLEPDEFIGQIVIPLSGLNSSDNKERVNWYTLAGKKKDSKKERGEIEVAFRFLSKQRDTVIHSKAASPRSIRVLTSGIRNKIRRRSEDEDSGLDASEGDKSLGLGRGRSYENLSTPSILDSDNKFERSFRTSSTNSSPGAFRSARGSAKLSPPSSNLSNSRAMSIEVLHQPDLKPPLSPLVRTDSGLGSGGSSSNSGDSNSGGGGSSKMVKRFIKQHARNRSLPDAKLLLGQLRKDETSKSALCINGPHLYVTGADDSGRSSVAASPEVKHRSSSMEDVSVPIIKSKTQMPLNKNLLHSTRRHSMVPTLDIKNSESTLTALYKPKTYYRLDVKELVKVSTIHEDPTSYQSMTHEELVKLVNAQQQTIKKKDSHIRELEDYIDSLLVKVMTFTPQILDESLDVRSTKLDKKLTKF